MQTDEADLIAVNEYIKQFRRDRDGDINFSQIDLNNKSIDAITEMLSDEMSDITITKKGEPYFMVSLVSIMSEVFSIAVEKNKIKRIEMARPKTKSVNPFVYATSFSKSEPKGNLGARSQALT